MMNHLAPTPEIPTAAPTRLVNLSFDSCWIDGRPVRDVAGWETIIRQGRLADVTGAYALAWHEPDGSLCLARDPIGERSLFYAKTPRGVKFASTVREILATGEVDPKINLLAVARYLTYGYLPGPDTLLEGVRKLLPGELLRFSNGTAASTPLWSLPEEPDGGSTPDEESMRLRLRAELEAAVRRRLPAEGPVGAFLSGGVDSSLIVALLRRLYEGTLYTYSVSFGPDYPNELAFSSLVADHCKTSHRIVELSPSAILQHLDESIAMLSDPIGDPLTVPNAILFREASRDVGVVFNGEGGDPCFGGPKNVPMLLAELYGDESSHSRERSYLRAHQKCYDDLDLMLTPDVRAACAEGALESELTPFFTDQRWTTFIGKLMAINTAFKGPFHILHKVESVSAPSGVVPRSPLFDRAIVEMAFTIPAQLKLRGTVEKYLLKEAVRDLLPQVIIDRPKSGMLVPVESWFKGPLLSHARERLLDGLPRYGLFQTDYLERLLSGRLTGVRPRRGIKIWMLVTLESWLRGNI